MGWEESFNETITDFSLISPAGRFVHKRKAWVKLSNKHGFWPAIVYLRTAWSAGEHDQFGSNNLKHTEIIYVHPFAPFKMYQVNHGGYWAYVKNVSSFSTNKQHRINMGMRSKFKTDFQLFLSKFETATKSISSDPFELDGSLPLLSVDHGFKTMDVEETDQLTSPMNSQTKLKHRIKNTDKQHSELNSSAITNSLIEVMKCGYNELKLLQKNSSTNRKKNKTENWNIQTHFEENFLRIKHEQFKLLNNNK